MSREFDKELLEGFLGTVRKYMQVRGALSQKDLAKMANIGVSTMSRFLNQQTKELNPQLIAKIVAVLNIPLHEMIDFVDEDYAEHFIRLVKLYKGEEAYPQEGVPPAGTGNVEMEAVEEGFSDVEEEDFAEALTPGGTAKRKATAKVKVGGRQHSIPFEATPQDSDYKEKLSNLTARQKGFLHDFLNLDSDGKDLVVDIGKNIISYLRQKGIDF